MNKFHAFLNDDTLLVRIKNKQTTNYEVKNDIAILYNNEEVIGYNIFNFKPLNVTSSKQGQVDYDINIQNEVNKRLMTIDQPELEMDDVKKYFVVGYVKELEKHPDSKKLHIAQVDFKDSTSQIVCGAKNIEQGQKVVVAKPGAVLFNGTWIAKGKLMKVDSAGMICSSKELGLTKESNGILVLDEDATVGSEFFNEN